MSEMRDRDQERGYRGTTGRVESSYSERTSQKQPTKSQYNRQIMSGADIKPPARAGKSYPATNAALTQPQLTYAAALGGMLVLGLVLWLVFGMGVASIVFFLLALGLIGGWLAF